VQGSTDDPCDEAGHNDKRHDLRPQRDRRDWVRHRHKLCPRCLRATMARPLAHGTVISSEPKNGSRQNPKVPAASKRKRSPSACPRQ
jgi:hypothetical protein